MIKIIEQMSPDERLDLILDKISSLGFNSINSIELDFLNSYSTFSEYEFNRKFLNVENKKFISDDGNFTFILDEVEVVEDVKFLHGKMIVPDIKEKNKKIKGELIGSIVIFNKNNIAMDFRKGEYEIFEFAYGLETELDCFVDDLIEKLIK